MTYWINLVKERQVMGGYELYQLGIQIIIFIIAARYYIRYRGAVRRELDFLNTKQELMEAHYIAVQMQTCQMEAARAAMQAQMYEITREKSEEIYGKRAKEYLRNLNQGYDKIFAGNYCNDWLLEAFLYCETEVFRRKGIALECLLQGYNRGNIEEKDLMQMLFCLFRSSIRLEKECSAKICLHMTIICDQLVIVLNCINLRLSFSGKARIRKYLQKYSGILNVEKKQNDEEIIIGLKCR